MNIFVGNLSYSSTDEDIRGLFEPSGEVSSAKVINDRETGRSRGFAFVEMPNDDEGRAAIAALNDREVGGRQLRVSEAQGRPERGDRGPRSGGGGFRQERFGGGGGGGGYRRDRF